MKMNDFMAVKQDGEGVLGKLLYFSLGNILIDRDVFNEIGTAMDLPKATVTRICLADAFRSATGDIYDRIVTRNPENLKIIKVYCRDNDRSNPHILRRELVKETLGAATNRYTKLANLYFDKDSELFGYDTEGYDDDIYAYSYCEKAEELFNLHRRCVRRGQIETILEHQLVKMQTTKVNHGKIYFCPRTHMQYVDVFEQYLEELGRQNLNSTSTITVNSLYVVDNEKQREKMASEFYGAIKKEIALYAEKLDYLISSGSQSPSVMNRWALKVSDLETKKRDYESILQRDFETLDNEFAILRLQAQELTVRAKRLKPCA